jgi:hypothetical protein
MFAVQKVPRPLSHIAAPQALDEKAKNGKAVRGNGSHMDLAAYTGVRLEMSVLYWYLLHLLV